MNKNSQHIGLKQTLFANPTGLSNSKNFSTAKDIALLTAHCLNNRILRDIFCRKRYDCEIINQKLATKRYCFTYEDQYNGKTQTSIFISSKNVLE